MVMYVIMILFKLQFLILIQNMRSTLKNKKINIHYETIKYFEKS